MTRTLQDTIEVCWLCTPTSRLAFHRLIEQIVYTERTLVKIYSKKALNETQFNLFYRTSNNCIETLKVQQKISHATAGLSVLLFKVMFSINNVAIFVKNITWCGLQKKIILAVKHDKITSHFFKPNDSNHDLRFDSN